MERIPVQFHYQNQTYNGSFEKVSGSGNNASYHLMVDKFYHGQINHSQHFGWRFTSNNDDFMKTMAKHFEEFIADKVEL